MIAASNAELDRAIAEGRFREDLFFRLNLIEVVVPPLALRSDDILPLARHFLESFAASSGRQPLALSPAAEAALLAYQWPGNVRELENRIQRATVVAAGDVVSVDGLGFSPAEDGARPVLGDQEQRERSELLAALAAAGGVVAHAADRLGVSRQALYRRMTRLGIEMARRPR